MWDINNDGNIDQKDEEMMAIAMMYEHERESQENKEDEEYQCDGSSGEGCGCGGILGAIALIAIVEIGWYIFKLIISG